MPASDTIEKKVAACASKVGHYAEVIERFGVAGYGLDRLSLAAKAVDVDLHFDAILFETRRAICMVTEMVNEATLAVSSARADDVGASASADAPARPAASSADASAAAWWELATAITRILTRVRDRLVPAAHGEISLDLEGLAALRLSVREMGVLISDARGGESLAQYLPRARWGTRRRRMRRLDAQLASLAAALGSLESCVGDAWLVLGHVEAWRRRGGLTGGSHGRGPGGGPGGDPQRVERNAPVDVWINHFVLFLAAVGVSLPTWRIVPEAGGAAGGGGFLEVFDALPVSDGVKAMLEFTSQPIATLCWGILLLTSRRAHERLMHPLALTGIYFIFASLHATFVAFSANFGGGVDRAATAAYLRVATHLVAAVLHLLLPPLAADAHLFRKRGFGVTLSMILAAYPSSFVAIRATADWTDTSRLLLTLCACVVGLACAVFLYVEARSGRGFFECDEAISLARPLMSLAAFRMTRQREMADLGVIPAPRSRAIFFEFRRCKYVLRTERIHADRAEGRSRGHSNESEHIETQRHTNGTGNNNNNNNNNSSNNNNDNNNNDNNNDREENLLERDPLGDDDLKAECLARLQVLGVLLPPDSEEHQGAFTLIRGDDPNHCVRGDRGNGIITHKIEMDCDPSQCSLLASVSRPSRATVAITLTAWANKSFLYLAYLAAFNLAGAGTDTGQREFMTQVVFCRALFTPLAGTLSDGSGNFYALLLAACLAAVGFVAPAIQTTAAPIARPDIAGLVAGGSLAAAVQLFLVISVVTINPYLRFRNSMYPRFGGPGAVHILARRYAHAALIADTISFAFAQIVADAISIGANGAERLNTLVTVMAVAAVLCAAPFIVAGKLFSRGWGAVPIGSPSDGSARGSLDGSAASTPAEPVLIRSTGGDADIHPSRRGAADRDQRRPSPGVPGPSRASSRPSRAPDYYGPSRGAARVRASRSRSRDVQLSSAPSPSRSSSPSRTSSSGSSSRPRSSPRPSASTSRARPSSRGRNPSTAPWLARSRSPLRVARRITGKGIAPWDATSLLWTAKSPAVCKDWLAGATARPPLTSRVALIVMDFFLLMLLIFLVAMFFGLPRLAIHLMHRGDEAVQNVLFNIVAGAVAAVILWSSFWEEVSSVVLRLFFPSLRRFAPGCGNAPRWMMSAVKPEIFARMRRDGVLRVAVEILFRSRVTVLEALKSRADFSEFCAMLYAEDERWSGPERPAMPGWANVSLTSTQRTMLASDGPAGVTLFVVPNGALSREREVGSLVPPSAAASPRPPPSRDGSRPAGLGWPSSLLYLLDQRVSLDPCDPGRTRVTLQRATGAVIEGEVEELICEGGVLTLVRREEGRRARFTATMLSTVKWLSNGNIYTIDGMFREETAPPAAVAASPARGDPTRTFYTCTRVPDGDDRRWGSPDVVPPKAYFIFTLLYAVVVFFNLFRREQRGETGGVTAAEDLILLSEYFMGLFAFIPIALFWNGLLFSCWNQLVDIEHETALLARELASAAAGGGSASSEERWLRRWHATVLSVDAGVRQYFFAMRNGVVACVVTAQIFVVAVVVLSIVTDIEPTVWWLRLLLATFGLQFAVLLYIIRPCAYVSEATRRMVSLPVHHLRIKSAAASETAASSNASLHVDSIAVLVDRLDKQCGVRLHFSNLAKPLHVTQDSLLTLAQSSLTAVSLSLLPALFKLISGTTRTTCEDVLAEIDVL